MVMNLIGSPVTSLTESTAPPRVSESTLVTTMPVPSTASSKSRARVTASWPVIASTTISTSVGSISSASSASSSANSSSRATAPRVSITTAVALSRAASLSARLAISGAGACFSST